MVDVAEHVRHHSRHSSLDSLFCSPPPEEVPPNHGSATDPPQPRIIVDLEAFRDPPTPGGVCFSDDEDVQQGDNGTGYHEHLRAVIPQPSVSSSVNHNAPELEKGTLYRDSDFSTHQITPTTISTPKTHRLAISQVDGVLTRSVNPPRRGPESLPTHSLFRKGDLTRSVTTVNATNSTISPGLTRSSIPIDRLGQSQTFSQLGQLMGYSDSEEEEEEEIAPTRQLTQGKGSGRKQDGIGQQPPNALQRSSTNKQRRISQPPLTRWREGVQQTSNVSKPPARTSEKPRAAEMSRSQSAHSVGLPSRTAPATGALQTDRKRPLSRGSSSDPKRVKTINPFLDFSGDEEEVTPAPKKRLNLNRLKEVLAKNAPNLGSSQDQERKFGREEVTRGSNVSAKKVDKPQVEKTGGREQGAGTSGAVMKKAYNHQPQEQNVPRQAPAVYQEVGNSRTQKAVSQPVAARKAPPKATNSQVQEMRGFETTTTGTSAMSKRADSVKAFADRRGNVGNIVESAGSRFQARKELNGSAARMSATGNRNTGYLAEGFKKTVTPIELNVAEKRKTDAAPISTGRAATKSGLSPAENASVTPDNSLPPPDKTQTASKVAPMTKEKALVIPNRDSVTAEKTSVIPQKTPTPPEKTPTTSKIAPIYRTKTPVIPRKSPVTAEESSVTPSIGAKTAPLIDVTATPSIRPTKNPSNTPQLTSNTHKATYSITPKPILSNTPNAAPSTPKALPLARNHVPATPKEASITTKQALTAPGVSPITPSVSLKSHKVSPTTPSIATDTLEEQPTTLNELVITAGTDEPQKEVSYFEYTVHQKTWSSTSPETSALETPLITHRFTTLEAANAQASTLYLHTTQHHPHIYPIHFQEWTTTRDAFDCTCHHGTTTPIEYPTQKSHIKIWVQRHAGTTRHTYQNPFSSNPNSPTPFINKSIFILRLHKLIPNDSDNDDDDDEEEREEQNETPPIREHQSLPPSFVELYTTLDAANRAARRLQIELSHEVDPQSQATRVWQEQNRRDLYAMVYKLDAEGGEKEGCWRSVFNRAGRGGDRFEVLVERVGVVGPRNL